MDHSPYGHPAWIEIDLNQFQKNIAIIKKHIGAVRFCLPVKANAYGHGLIPIAKAAAQGGVDYLGVSCLQEGALLRKAGIKIPILVFGAIHQEQIPELLAYQLEFTIASSYKAKMVADICNRLQSQAKIHLEIDTGMQRTGVQLETAPSVLALIKANKNLQLVGVYSHLATADEVNNNFTTLQIERFTQFIDQYFSAKEQKKILFHLANSAGVMHYPTSYLDMVRPGILAFGHCINSNEALKEIKPFFTVKAKIAYFKVVKKGQGIGYGHRYITPEDTRIITIPLGYGDGYRRSLSNQGNILLHNKKYPIAGIICMDQFMVDIGQDTGLVGDTVIVIGTDKESSSEITITEIANSCETIPYEILCGFNNRLPRLYHSQQSSFWES